MNANKFLPPPVRLSQAFEPEKFSGGASGSEITRRSFLKRTGGATMATLVAWNVASQQVRAEGGTGTSESESFGMLCIWPDLEGSIENILSRVLDIPQADGGTKRLHIVVDLATGKIEDPAGTTPYNYCQFGATAWIKASSPDGGNGPKWATYWVDYSIFCDPDNGEFTATVANQPWTATTINILVGTTSVTVNIGIVQPFTFDSNTEAVHSLTVDTKVSIELSYSLNGGIHIYVPNYEKISNEFLAFPKSYRMPLL